MNIINKYLFLFSVLCSLFSLAYASDIKQPNVSGQFYPVRPEELSRKIEGFLKTAQPKQVQGEILGLISPHAGYDYSGSTAAYGYKTIGNRHFDTVVVLAFSHTQDFEGIAIWPKGEFSTPLGNIAVDEELSKKLQALNPNIKENPSAFENEHSLEVQLPFLQVVLKDFKLVPLIMGRFNLSDCDLLAHSLKLLLEGKNALLVVTTDLSHYHPYQEAGALDKSTLSFIQKDEPRALYAAVGDKNAELCGLGPVLTFLYYAKEKGLNIEVLKYANSGDVTGDLSAVVGYASIAAYKSNPKGLKEEVNMLNKGERKRLLEIARKSVQVYLEKGEVLEVAETDPVLNKKMGVFVTFTSGASRGKLLGCIGSIIGEQPLYLTVRDKAIDAAVNDPRFSPVQLSELKDVEIEISVLSELEKVDGPDKVEFGKHGVLIQKGYRGGVFLPQVAGHFLTKEDFLSELCAQKAGLPPDCWRDGSAEIYVFTAEVFSEKEY